MNVKEMVSKMTAEEKASLCSGLNFWFTKPVEGLGIPSVMLTDGPHGLRKQGEKADHLAILESVKAVCFPAGCAMAASFDRALLRELGETLGRQAQAEDVAVLLGPAMNIKRNPLCGRNFEYFSEDPYLTGELAAAYVQGLQSQGVGASPKHFALNNQEHERMANSSECDERTMREIYLAAFETVVRKARPWTVMSSYNKINGVFAGESPWLLTGILRDEWGFDGYVVSDWGAVSDRVTALKAGLDLEMPASGGDNDTAIVAALKTGALDEAVLDRAVERVLTIHEKFLKNRNKAVWDKEGDHQKAVEFSKQCVVLLQNDGILPLRDASAKTVFIGGFAETPRYQGGGSSHINPWKVSSPLETARTWGTIVYAEGFHAGDDTPDPRLHAEAVEAAKNAHIAVIFAGLPDSYESEGYDRRHMNLPDCQNALIADILKVQKNVVVVLQNGSPVELPWAKDVRAIVEAYLGGEGSGEAVAAILWGKANPGGKLPESFPLRYQDVPSSLQFPGAGKKTVYSEGVFVGYRYYDSKEMELRFPFGHGLSYTTFALSNLRLSATTVREPETLSVSVDVTNTGPMAGKEVVQLYVRDNTGAAVRPARELKGFEAVHLQKGETKTVVLTLDARSFQWYNPEIHDWYAESGDYTLLIGTSSRNIAFTETVAFISGTKLPFTVTQDTQIGELAPYPEAWAFMKELISGHLPILAGGADESQWNELGKAFIRYMPLRAMRSFGGVSGGQIAQLVDKLNGMIKPR